MIKIHTTSFLLSLLFILFFASFFLFPANASACTSDIDCPGGECTGREVTTTCDENNENCVDTWSEGSCTTTTPPGQCEYFFCEGGFCRRSQFNTPSDSCGGNCDACQGGTGGSTPSPTTASPSPSPTLGACNTSCSTGADCASGVCTGTVFGNLCDCSSTTSPAPCNSNGIQDNGETGIDCGGGGCSACSSGGGGGGGGSPPAGEPSCTVYTCSVDGVTVSASICCSCGSSGLCANNNTTISCGGSGNPCPPPPTPDCSGVCSASPVCGTTTNGTDTGCGSSCSVTGGPCCSGVCSAPTVCGTTTNGTDTGCGSSCSVTGGPCPWWQAKDADLISQGDIRSIIPSSAYKLIDDGSGGYPGVVAYSGTISTGTGTLSSKDWKAQITPSPYTGRRYDYEYFTGRVPQEIFTNPDSVIANYSIGASELKNGYQKDGYVWRYRDGDLIITGTGNMGDSKVILLVRGSLTISNNITLDDGEGFFGAIVKGDLTLDPAVSHPNNPALEGIFLTDGVFSTGAGSARLYLRGSVVAWGGVDLQRDLGNQNSTTAAEYFEYAPDLLMTFPRELFRRGRVWREIAP